MPRHELSYAGTTASSATCTHVPAPPQIRRIALPALRRQRSGGVHRFRLGYPPLYLGLRLHLQPGGDIVVVEEAGNSGAIFMRSRNCGGQRGHEGGRVPPGPPRRSGFSKDRAHYARHG
eukprot:1487637-Pleurochrysis_carterae.AAC.1